MKKATYKNKSVILDNDLIKANNVSKYAFNRLLTLYLHKKILFEAMEFIDDPEKLKVYDKKLTDIDYEIQTQWNFVPDSKYHRYWERPKCTCPKMDNEERFGTIYTIKDTNCPLHG